MNSVVNTSNPAVNPGPAGTQPGSQLGSHVGGQVGGHVAGDTSALSEPPMSNTASTLFAVAERHGLKDAWLARCLDCDPSYISRLRSGQHTNIPFRLVAAVFAETQDPDLVRLLETEKAMVIAVPRSSETPSRDRMAERARWCISEVLRIDDPAIHGISATAETITLKNLVTISAAIESLALLADTIAAESRRRHEAANQRTASGYALVDNKGRTIATA